MCEQAKIEFPDKIAYENSSQISENELHPIHQMLLDSIFGKIGEEFDKQGQKICRVIYPNLRIEQYDVNKAWLTYLLQEEDYQPFISKDSIVSVFTEIRQQTAIDETGVARAHSLRAIRVAKKGCTFCGQIRVESDDQSVVDTLALACLNLRHMGTKRNRGFGEIACRLFESQQKIDRISLIIKKLEDLCYA
jgi:CRISPR-associated protein Csx10